MTKQYAGCSKQNSILGCIVKIDFGFWRQWHRRWYKWQDFSAAINRLH